MNAAPTRPTRAGQAGLSLVELLVAMTIMALAMTITLTVYDGARRSYERGEISTEQQQIARIAFDVIRRDVWLAGLNLFPDGDADRPDEAIEAAYAHALVVRADYDGDDAADAVDPELPLSGGAYVYGSVSTGNDEIRGFVLSASRPDGTATGPESFTFDADVKDGLRDGVAEPVTVSDVVLTPDGRPYSLYRISLSNDTTKYGTPQFINRTVLADNIRSLRFRYYDLAGNEIAPPGGGDDPASVRARGSIARVSVEVEVLPRHDTADGRRPIEPFLLTGDVAPRNLDKVRIIDSGAALWQPGRVGTPTLTEGHCGVLRADWPPNPTHDRVAYYRIYYGTDPRNLSGRDTSTNSARDIRGLAEGEDYTVRVAAVNTAGVEGPLSPPMDRVTQNYNTPESPTSLAAAPDGISHILVSWDAVTRNTAAVPDADFLDFAGYRLYRSTTSGSGADPGDLFLREDVLGDTGSPAFTDDKAVSCRTYYYVVTAVDDCGVESEPSAEVSGQVSSTANLTVPTGVNAFFDGTDVRVRWDRVRDDVDGNSVWVEDYRVYRAGPLLTGSDPPVMPIDFAQIATVRGTIEFREPRPSPGYESWYAVEAVDDCGNDSGPSTPALASCTFHGDVRFQWPRFAEEYGSPMHIEVYVDNPVGSYNGLRVTFRNEDDLSTRTLTWGGPGPIWVYDMAEVPGGVFTPGWYTLTAEVDQFDGPTLCTDSTVTRARLR